VFRQIYHYLVISKSGLFDRYFYLKSNPDVRKNDMDPLWHFVSVGWKEGRNPSKDINMLLLVRRQKVTDGKPINPLIQLIKDNK